eukprot:9659009-Ditylum_brightwellii.AAC.1
MLPPTHPNSFSFIYSPALSTSIIGINMAFDVTLDVVLESWKWFGGVRNASYQTQMCTKSHTLECRVQWKTGDVDQ